MTTLENIHWSGVSPRAYFIAGYTERVGVIDDGAYHITLQDAAENMGISQRTVVRGLQEWT